MSVRGYQDVPYPLGTPEWKSFKKYAKACYKDGKDLAEEVASPHGLTILKDDATFRIVLTAVTSPLVFLWQKWQIMSLDAKMKYATPKYKVELEKIKAEAQKIKEKAGTA